MTGYEIIGGVLLLIVTAAAAFMVGVATYKAGLDGFETSKIKVAVIALLGGMVLGFAFVELFVIFESPKNVATD